MRSIEALKAEFTFHRQLFTVAIAVSSGTSVWLINNAAEYHSVLNIIAAIVSVGGLYYARIRYQHIFTIIQEMTHA